MSFSITPNTPEMNNRDINNNKEVNLLNKAAELAKKHGELTGDDMANLEQIAKSDGNLTPTETYFLDSLKINAKEFVTKVKDDFDPNRFSWKIEDKAPHLRVLPFDLKGISEVDELDKINEAAKTENKGALFAVAGKDGKFHPERTPVIIVHGVAGNFNDNTVKPLLDRLKNDETKQVYVFAYHDVEESQNDNGVQMAKEIKELLKNNPGIKDVDIVAHSMGGIIAKRALNELYEGNTQKMETFNKVGFKFVAVDTPWHGYFADDNSDGKLPPRQPAKSSNSYDFVSGDNFLPSSGKGHFKLAGASGMKADRKLFTGDPQSQNKAERDGIAGVKLPGNVEIQLVSAKDSWVAKDAMKYISKLNDKEVLKLARALRDGEPEKFFKPSQINEKNYFKMFMQDSDWPQAKKEIAGLLDLEPSNQIDSFKKIIEKYMPSFKGGHSSVLENKDLLNEVQKNFTPKGEVFYLPKDAGIAKDAMKFISKLNDKDIIKLAKALRDGEPEKFFKPSQKEELNNFKYLMQYSDWPQAKAAIIDLLDSPPGYQVEPFKKMLDKYLH